MECLLLVWNLLVLFDSLSASMQLNQRQVVGIDCGFYTTNGHHVVKALWLEYDVGSLTNLHAVSRRLMSKV